MSQTYLCMQWGFIEHNFQHHWLTGLLISYNHSPFLIVINIFTGCARNNAINSLLYYPYYTESTDRSTMDGLPRHLLHLLRFTFQPATLFSRPSVMFHMNIRSDNRVVSFPSDESVWLRLTYSRGGLSRQRRGSLERRRPHHPWDFIPWPYCRVVHFLCVHTNRIVSSQVSRSQWPRGLRHELPSPARTLGSRVRIPLEAWMFVCVLFRIYAVLLCSLATGWSPVRGVLPTV
jgi:hypothetical protein